MTQLEIELPMTEEEEEEFWARFRYGIKGASLLSEWFSDVNRVAMGRVARGRKLEGAHGEVMQEVLRRMEEATR